MLHTVEDTPDLAVHKYPSAALYAVVRQNLLALDQATRIGRNAYCGGQGHPQEYVARNPFRKSWGAFRYLPGMTTLTWVMNVSGRASGDSVRLYINGALVQTSAISSNGILTFTYSLGTLTNYSVVEVQWDIYSASRASPVIAEGTAWGLYEIIDAYVSPVTLADSWPGVPTFTTVYDAAKLTQLSNAVDWLVRRVGRRTDPLFTTLTRHYGPYGPTTKDPAGYLDTQWYGSIITTSAATTLKVMGTSFIEVDGGDEEIRLYVNEVLVQTYTVPSTVGRYTWTITYSMPETAGTRNLIRLRYRRQNNPLLNGGEPTNRWSVLRVWSEGSAGSATLSTIAPRTNMTWATWKAALNACASLASTIKSRIDNNLTLGYDRQYLFRGSYGYDTYQEGLFEASYVAAAIPRIGEAVLIRGTGNKVAWGAQIWDESAPNNVRIYPLNATYSESVNTDGTEATSLVYLDALSGLPPGASYNVRGAVAYAGEIWRVGTDV